MKIAEEIGASTKKYSTNGTRLTGFYFSSVPDQSIFKKVSRGIWYPKKNNKTGKELDKRIRSLSLVDIQSSLKLIGLDSSPSIFDSDNGVCYRPILIHVPTDPLRVFIKVPWWNCGPKELENYKKSNDLGILGDSNYDALLWEPPIGLIEVREWELIKEIDDYNSSLSK